MEPDPQERPAVVALFSLRVRRWRKARKILLKQMACDLGVSVSLVSAWENGVRFPSVANLQLLSAYTGIPVCQFFYPQDCDCPNQNRAS